MIWSMTKFASVCAVAVLFLPGNEMHRSKVFDGFAGALQNAANYCDYQPETCDSVAEGIQTVSQSFSAQVGNVRSNLAKGRAYPRLEEAETWQSAQPDGYGYLPRSQ